MYFIEPISYWLGNGIGGAFDRKQLCLDRCVVACVWKYGSVAHGLDNVKDRDILEECGESHVAALVAVGSENCINGFRGICRKMSYYAPAKGL